LRIRRRVPAPLGVLTVPAWVPAAGLAISLALLVFDAAQRFGAR
jgi:hypothetical protein